jgi:hypothetical protein
MGWKLKIFSFGFHWMAIVTIEPRNGEDGTIVSRSRRSSLQN